MTRSPSSDRLAEAIAKLRALTQISVQPQWRCHWGDASISQVATWQTWAKVLLNAKNQVGWAKGRQVLWLAQRVLVPHNLGGYPLQGLTLRLALTWWAESAQVYVNGKLVQEGDLFDATTRLLLSESVRHNDAFDVAIRLESPVHDNGALVKALCIYESDSYEFDSYESDSYEFADRADPPEPGFVADELAVLREFITAFAPTQLESVAQAVGKIPWSVLTVCDRISFDRALANLRQQLQPLGKLIKQRKIQLLGHAHLDMAWLWTVSETWQVAERTFRSVLNLQKDFPELTYCHTTPALYEWMEKNRPELFAAVKAQVAIGRWEVSVAPLWIEPEMNLLGGEAIVRHLLYGQRYLQQAFGQRGEIAWLPDTFGFNWQLPQFLKQGGVEYFVTQKLRWNDTTKFPHEAHWWQAPDGTKVFSLQSAPIGEGIDPVKMAQYACTWETKTSTQTCLWLTGVGDHGGGPTRDMLQLARRWGRSPFFPQLEFTTAQKFLDSTRQAAASQVTAPDIAASAGSVAQKSVAFPTWNNELYLELHRGCYTNHADQKQYNRRCEDTLYEAELFASLRTLITGAAYPKAELEAAWKKVLFNQFHDILPGSSIAPVFVEANRTWQEALDTGWNIRQEALKAIASQIQLPPPPQPQAKLIAIFNSLNWKRSEVVTLSVQQSQNERACFWQVCDLAGREVVSQPHCWRENGITHCQIFFQAEEIPAIGYRCYWLLPRSTGNPVPAVPTNGFMLENDRLRVTIDPTTGNLSGLRDKLHQRDLLSRAGNELQAFRDSGQYWDAWNIDPKYAQYPLPPAQLTQIFYEDRGAVTTRIRVVRKLGKSTFNQVYILDKGSAVLKIHTQVDWQERHVVVKATFPLNLDAAYATYEIPCGAIQRSTRPQDSAEKAKWEVSALRWADLSDTASQNSYGVSILSDCKQGYDSQPHQIRLTLLRGSEWPDPNSDRGQHQFTYAIYPHDRSWQSAQTVRQGYALNQPLRALVSELPQGTLPSTATFLDLQANNLVLTALKPSEQEPDRWILRCYEAHGEKAQVQFGNSGILFDRYLDAASVQPTNLLEEPVADDKSGTIAPWKITTFKVKRFE
ncbi:MAG: alpha-mannosidase [Drouetiella hepatica Uher 2000/2452]|jgi:alpha-mannosidase|uniref:Alpha-mannosidase n=1 Tax=Drouetiella hepatica Uher 2000/2452 TaxID=904376 RepID=A0A951ULM3_9CYAN|nr:alpha-mannosidase [Drouetiella hepatica Uher 2000/2452]